MPEPIVSVLMTAYNREQYIAEAIESVLASQYPFFELIVVDDCSTDATVSIVQQFVARDKRVQLFINEQNLGDYPNRNKAASYASGKYIKFLDADDAIYPWGLGAMVAAMEAFPEAGFGLAAAPEDNRPYPVCISPVEIYREHFYGFNHFDRAPGSSIIKKSAFDAVNGFSGERMVGDLELWPRLARQYAMVKFPFDLYWNRVHTGQEVQSDYAKKIYPIRTKQILMEALNHKNCPLNSNEIKEIKSKIKRNQFKATALKWMAKFS